MDRFFISAIPSPLRGCDLKDNFFDRNTVSPPDASSLNDSAERDKSIYPPGASKFSLRDYQVRVIRKWIEISRSFRRICLQLPTGAGKTIIFCSILADLVARRDRALIIAHREELITQAAEKAEAISGLPVGIIKSGHPANPLYPIQVASIQTLTRRLDALPDAAIVIVDECHHASSPSYRKVLEQYPNGYILGVTATPQRNDGRGLRDIFDRMILGPSVAELINEGHLSQYKLFAADKPISTKGVGKVGGDYKQGALSAKARQPDVMGAVVPTWRRYANGLQTVVFCVDVAHSQDIAALYQSQGITAEHLDGATPAAERKAILQRFRDGKTTILTNCGIVSEGFDVPSIQAVQCLRPTSSLALWLQQVGRALRPAPGKDYAVILDHTSNWFKLGLPDEDREWSLDPIPAESGFTVACKECGHAFSPLASERQTSKADCPNCNASLQLPKPKPKGSSGGDPPFAELLIDTAEYQFLEIDPNQKANPAVLEKLTSLLVTVKERQYNPLWAYYRLLEINKESLTLADFRAIALALGYKPGWGWYRYQEYRAAQSQQGRAA